MSRCSNTRSATCRNLFSLVAKRIDSIPTLPLAQARIIEAASRDSANALEVSRLVEADPALTAKILRVLNSPFYGRRMKVSTLSHAIAMLGLPALRNLAAGIATFDERPEGDESLDRERFWQHSLAVATAARCIAKEVEYDLPEEAYLGGLLHDMGKLVLDLYAPSEYRDHVEECEKDGSEVVGTERRHLGTDHCQVGTLIAEHWNLPRVLKDAIQFHHHPGDQRQGLSSRHGTLVDIVAVADRLCWACGLGSLGGGRRDADEFGIAEYGTLSPEQVEKVITEVTGELKAAASRFGISFGTGEAFLEGIRKANRETKRRTVRGEEPIDIGSRMQTVRDVVQQVHRCDVVDQMIEEGIIVAQRGLGFDRLLYLQADFEEDRLRGRFHCDDTHIEIDVHEIDLPLSSASLLGMAFREGEAQRVDNWATDGMLLSLLGVVEVAAVPLIVRRDPQGIICADYFFRNREISDTDVTLLGLVGMELGLAIESMVLSQQAKKLRSLAAKDELTGVNNRRNLMKLLQSEIDRSMRYRTLLSTVMVDIDDFKKFNDSYGHQAGDRILAEVVQLIVSISRDVDIIGRYGGEEFLIVLPETQLDQAIIYSERLRTTVEQFGREKRDIYPKCELTISLGVTSLEHGEDDIERVIRRVDRALYAAKARGRNCVCVD